VVIYPKTFADLNLLGIYGRLDPVGDFVKSGETLVIENWQDYSKSIYLSR